MQETDEPAKKKTTAEEEEEESEVKRIERELETSADELCQGAAAAGSSVDLKSATTDSVSQSAEEKPKQAAAAANGDKDPLPDDPEAVVADDLEDLLCDMMIQTSSSHFQHPRQPMQNYGHGMHHGSLRQGSYHHHHHYHQHHQVSRGFGTAFFILGRLVCDKTFLFWPHFRPKQQI